MRAPPMESMLSKSSMVGTRSSSVAEAGEAIQARATRGKIVRRNKVMGELLGRRQRGPGWAGRGWTRQQGLGPNRVSALRLPDESLARTAAPTLGFTFPAAAPRPPARDARPTGRHASMAVAVGRGG